MGFEFKPSFRKVGNDIDFILGSDGDIRLRLRATAMSADSGDNVLPALFKGASDHQSIGNNTFILSNITSDGDVLLLVNDGGISKEFLHVDASIAVLTLGHAMASVRVPTDLLVKTGKQLLLYDADDSNYVGFVAPALTADKVWTLPTTDGTNGQVLTTNGSGVLAWSAGGASASWGDDALLNLGTSNDIAQVLRSTILAANTALIGVLIGIPVTQALAANSLIIANQTADGDLLLAINDGGTSKSVLAVVGATAVLTLGHGMASVALGATLDMNSKTITEIGNAGSELLADAWTMVGANAQMLLVETTGAAVNGVTKLKIPAAGTGSSLIRFTQGSGNGDADNMEYYLEYTGSGAIFQLASQDANGSSIPGAVFQIADGTDDVMFIGGISVSAGAAPTSGIDMNSTSIIKVGNIGSQLLADAWTMVGANAQMLLVETTGAAAFGALNLKIPASGTGSSIIRFTQGSGNGDANNMQYYFEYQGTEGVFRLSSQDVNGLSALAAVFEVADGTDDVMFTGGISTDGVAAPTSGLTLGIAAKVVGIARFVGTTSGVVTLTVGAIAGTWTMTLPAAVGTAGFQLTDAAGNGVTSWAAAASRREWKNDLGVVSPQDGLDQILNTKAVHRFTYKEGRGTGDYETQYVGVFADEAPWAMHFGGDIVNPVNTLGYMVLGFQAIDERVTRLERQLIKAGITPER